MGAESRVLKLEDKLTMLGFTETLKGVDLIKDEMNAKKGFKRHDGSDYFVHCTDVTLILVNAGIRDQTTLTAAVGHDYAEDVDGITIETIKHLFGQEVAETVRPLTKQKGINYKDLNNLKAHYQPILKNWRSSLIKATDIWHNMSTLDSASDEKKARKIIEAREVFIPFLKEAREKFPRYSHFFWSAKFAIEPIVERLENEIKLAKRVKELESTLGMDKDAKMY